MRHAQADYMQEKPASKRKAHVLAGIECQHCGGYQSLLPAPMDGVLGVFNEFLAAHKSCPTTCDPRCAPRIVNNLKKRG